MRFRRRCCRCSQFRGADLPLRRGPGDVGLLHKDTCPTDKAIGSRGTCRQHLAGALRGDDVVRDDKRDLCQRCDAGQMGELAKHRPTWCQGLAIAGIRMNPELNGWLTVARHENWKGSARIWARRVVIVRLNNYGLDGRILFRKSHVGNAARPPTMPAT